jgi:serine/threonine-protein kinase
MALRGGRYEILGTIASGGMATVHLGRVLGAGGFERLVALKVMHPHLAKEPDFVAMFLDEARLAARIRHPNVVGTLDIQKDAQGLFLVMEYVEGTSLSRLLRTLAKRGERLPIGVALRIFADTLAGLHAAHELTGPDGEPLHLIHRDISPHNILVGADGVARITDFGIARAESRLATTRTGSLKGKVMYMAPEQIRSEPLDRRTDLYAAGAVLWEELTGERMVRGESDMAMMHEIVHGNRKPPHEVQPSVPRELSAVCLRALERDPALRYPTATAFLEAVEKAAAAAGVAIAPPRAVAELVRELGLHQVAVEPVADESAAPAEAAAREAATVAAAADGEVAPGAAAARAAAPGAGSPGAAALRAAAPGAAAAEAPVPPSDTNATFERPSRAEAPSRRRPVVLIAIAAVLGGAAVAGWLFFGRSTAPQSGSGSVAAAQIPSSAGASQVSSSAGASQVPSSSAAAAQVPSAGAAAPPPAEARSAEPPAPASPSGTAAAGTSAPAASAAHTAKPRASGAPATPSKSFRPTEL